MRFAADQFGIHVILWSALMLAYGSIVFVYTVYLKDADYEAFLPWSLRLLLYSIPYALAPWVGLGMGAFILGTFGSRAAHRFGYASLFLGAAYSLFYVGSWLSASVIVN